MTFREYLDTLEGKSVAVIGAGISNTPLIEALLTAGINTTICDRRSRDDLGNAGASFEELGGKFRLGDNYLKDLNEDVIFRTPGLMPANPALLEAMKRGAVLTSEMEVFFDVCPCKIIAVTGSDGKTTTTSIIAELLRREMIHEKTVRRENLRDKTSQDEVMLDKVIETEGRRIHIGGNIGTPLLCEADNMKPDDITVLELSSFQLVTMKKSPDIAVVTNLAPNHLDIHKDMKEYIEAKRNIFLHQKPSDKSVFNFDNEYTRRFASCAPGEVLFFSSCGKVNDGCYIDSGTIFEVRKGRREAIIQADQIWLPGAHNIENYMAAFAAVCDLVNHDVMRETAETFRGIEHRIEFVREMRGVKFYNDSIASSPTRTIAGLRAFDKRVILIAGGKGKGIAFDKLGDEICKRVKTLVLTGMTAEQIHDCVVKAPGYKGTPEILLRDDFTDAILAAAEFAQAGDIVILSPACTSFDRFRNFEERGNKFKEIVMRL